MHLQLSDEQDALRDSVARFLEKASSAEAVREAEPLGWDAKVWAGLCDMGVPALGVAEALGGSGASLRDLAVVAEACGTRLAPAPVVEAMVAARLLSRFAGTGTDTRTDADVASDVLAALVEGGAPVVVAVRPAVDGLARAVPGAAVAAAVIALDGDDLVVVVQDDLPASPANLGSAPLADVDLTLGTRTVLASGSDAHHAHDRAVDEWRALTARWLVGLGREAQAVAVQYAKDRHQFGVAVGSFQAVQHRFADLATDLVQVRLLVRWVARLTDEDPDRMLPQEASMAKLASTELAKRCALEGMQIMGGYGYATEYPMERYLRGALVQTIFGGTSEIQRNIIAKTLGL